MYELSAHLYNAFPVILYTDHLFVGQGFWNVIFYRENLNFDQVSFIDEQEEFRACPVSSRGDSPAPWMDDPPYPVWLCCPLCRDLL